MSKIEWTDKAWNPMTGCQIISEGCRYCYAKDFAERMKHNTQPSIAKRYRNGFGPTFHPDVLGKPLHWTKPRRVFVCSMSDLFHSSFTNEQIAAVFGVMAACPQHTFQVMTKRPERMLEWFEWFGKAVGSRAIRTRLHAAINICQTHSGLYHHGKPVYIAQDVQWPLPNVWIGVTVENQVAADERIPLLLQVPAAVRFLSCEPLIGPVLLPNDSLTCDCCGNLPETVNVNDEIYCKRCHEDDPDDASTIYGGCLSIDWVIAGGGSGSKARPSHPDWFRALRDQCQAAGVPFFFKQWGKWGVVYEGETEPDETFIAGLPTPRKDYAWHGDKVVYMLPGGKKKAGRELDGRTWDEFPSSVPSSQLRSPRAVQDTPLGMTEGASGVGVASSARSASSQ